MIDPKIRQLLEEAIDSAIKLQLLLLFHESPQLSMNTSQVANRIFRDIWSTREALAELHQDGVLAIDDGDEPRYLYQPRLEHQERIERLVMHFNEPLVRDSIHNVLREVARNASYRRANYQVRGAYEMHMI